MVDFGAHFGDFGVHFGDFGDHFGDFGVHFGDFGAYFGGLGCPIGAQRLEQGPLPRRGRVRRSATGVRVTRFWGPKALCSQPKVDGKGANAICHGPNAICHGL